MLINARLPTDTGKAEREEARSPQRAFVLPSSPYGDNRDNYSLSPQSTPLRDSHNSTSSLSEVESIEERRRRFAAAAELRMRTSRSDAEL